MILLVEFDYSPNPQLGDYYTVEYFGPEDVPLMFHNGRYYYQAEFGKMSYKGISNFWGY